MCFIQELHIIVYNIVNIKLHNARFFCSRTSSVQWHMRAGHYIANLLNIINIILELFDQSIAMSAHPAI